MSSNRRYSERDDNFPKHKLLNSARIFFDFKPNFDRCAVFYSRILQYLLSKGYEEVHSMCLATEKTLREG